MPSFADFGPFTTLLTTGPSTKCLDACHGGIKNELWRSNASAKELFRNFTLLLLSFIPGIGEVQDVGVLKDSNAGFWSKVIAGTSLAIGVIGLTPNFGKAGQLLRPASRSLFDLLQSHTRGMDFFLRSWRTFTRQGQTALRTLGLSPAQITGLSGGRSVAFYLGGAAEGTVGVARIHPSGRLQVGIYTIRNEGGGLADFATFESRAHGAARALGASHVELMGLEITNSQLRTVLQRGGFRPTTIPAPAELGGGTLNGLSRIEPVK